MSVIGTWISVLRRGGIPFLIAWRMNHLAKNFWLLLGIALLVSAAVASPPQTPDVSANGGTRLIVNDEKVGPHLFRLGILPGSPKVGNLHLSVLIQAVEGDDVIQDGQIIIHATGPEPGIIAGPVHAKNAPLNPQLFEADIVLTTLGTWVMTLETKSELGESTLVIPLQVTEAEGVNLLIVIVFVVIILAIAALVWSQKKQRKRVARK